MKCKFIFNYVI